MIDTMDLDATLLRDTLVARDRLTVLQDEAERARLAYYQAVRRLHASGASTREIAEALNVSHQRVHQIVTGGDQMARTTPAKTFLHRLVGRGGNGCTPRRTPLAPGSDPFARFYADARTALARAHDEARAFGHSALGTEHLLLGLLGTEHGLAARLLAASGVESAQTRHAVAALVGRGEATPPGHLRVTPRLKKVLELAYQEAKSLRSTHVRSEHLLLGLAREGGGVGARILAAHHTGYAQLCRRVDHAALACSFCGRSGLDTARLITGPGVYICEYCTQEAARLVELGDHAPAHGVLSVVAADQAATCSFCGQHRPEGERLIAGPRVLICTACLTICREIAEDEGHGVARDRR
jgi:hypothetical protein